MEQIERVGAFGENSDGMRRKAGFNPKRRLAPVGRLDAASRDELAKRCRYGGNPEHKRNPADYGLTPPTNPRPGKTICDGERVILKDEARTLLVAGLVRGMMSERTVNGWPQNVWAVNEAGLVFEAQLENQTTGSYHGYPMPTDDDFRALILAEWRVR